MPKSYPHAVGFQYSYATARFQRATGFPDQVTLHVHLFERGHLHGGFHAQDLFVYQWT